MVYTPVGDEKMNLTGFLSLPSTADVVVIREADLDWTWHMICQRAEYLSHYFSSRNYQQVMLQSDDLLHFVVVLLACVDSQTALMVPSNLSTVSPEQFAATDLICSDERLDAVNTEGVPSLLLSDSLFALALSEQPNLTLNQDVSIALQTSGSSGQPKWVEKTWFAMLEETKALKSILPAACLSAQQMSSVTPRHLYGFTFRVMLSLSCAWEMVRERKTYPETLLGASLQKGDLPLVWISSPTLLHSLEEVHFKQGKPKVDLIISAGAALSPQQKIWLSDCLGARVLEIYGSTETGVLAYRLEQAYWQFFPDVKVLAQASGIEVSSPWCRDAQVLADQIVEHENGFELLGRMDRIIKIADQRISLQEIEQLLLQHDWVQDVHLTGAAHTQHLCALVAFSDAGLEAWCTQGRKSVIKTLKAYVGASYQAVAIPRYWRFDKRLPRNAQSKLNPQEVLHRIQNMPTMPIEHTCFAISEHEYRLEWEVPVDLKYFNGHFERFHLVPGVVQMKWVESILKRLTWIERAPQVWENLKFQQFLRPGDRFELHLKRDLAKAKINFAASRGDQKILSGRLPIVEESSCEV